MQLNGILSASGILRSGTKEENVRQQRSLLCYIVWLQDNCQRAQVLLLVTETISMSMPLLNIPNTF